VSFVYFCKWASASVVDWWDFLGGFICLGNLNFLEKKQMLAVVIYPYLLEIMNTIVFP
jgi:hypothetical protein